jgi:glycosyltransferase involved in cell wall biosynthesis
MFKNKNINKTTEEKSKVFRVGIDARFFGLENKGLGRYTNELVQGLDRIILENKNLKNKIKYYIFLPSNKFSEYNPSVKNIRKIKTDYKWYSWAEQIKFPFLLKKYDLDLMHFPHFNIPFLYRKKFIVTIHDLILFHYPTVKNTTLNKFVYFFKLFAYHFIIRSTIKRAEKIITISKFTRNDLIKTLKTKKNKIKVIYEGAEFNQLSFERPVKINCKNIIKKYGIMKPYLLYVGNAYPHKNLDRLVLAFSEVNSNFSNNYQLVLVGKNDYFYKKLKIFIYKNNLNNILITDYISDHKMNCLYQHSRLFIFPSLYEGFGLPPLEALIKDVPVVTSQESSMPEILGDNVQYFNPKETKDMIRAITAVLEDKKKNIHLTKSEKRYLQQKYSWKKMVKKINKLYIEQFE